MGKMQQWLTEHGNRYTAHPPQSNNLTAPENPAMREGEPRVRLYTLSMTSHGMKYSNDRSGPGPLAVLPLNQRKANSILAKTRTCRYHKDLKFLHPDKIHYLVSYLSMKTFHGWQKTRNRTSVCSYGPSKYLR